MLALPTLSHFILIPATQERTVSLPVLPIGYQQWGDSPLFIVGATETHDLAIC